jgi:hypothetical protein
MKDHIAYKYKISTLPHSFLIDKKGVVVKQFVGYKKDSLIEKELNKLFNEPIKNLKVNWNIFLITNKQNPKTAVQRVLK